MGASIIYIDVYGPTDRLELFTKQSTIQSAVTFDVIKNNDNSFD